MPILPSNTPAVALRPEAEVLLCCARTQMDAVRAERLRVLLGEKLDWDYVLETAQQHGMTPLLYWHLHATCPEAVPHMVLADLQDDFRANAQYNVFLMGKLLQLLRLFEAHHISAVPFKGPMLAACAYGNLALRAFSDLDILIHQRDVTRAKALLLSQGYSLRYPLPGAQASAHLHAYHAYTFAGSDGAVNVDLHWRFAPRHHAFSLGLEHVWERLEQVGLAGTTIFNIAPEDLLLILCMHGAKDGWTRLIWICDIATLIRLHRQMDWACMIKQAGALGSERRLFLGLLLAHNLLAADLPQDVLHRILTHAGVKSLATQVCERLFCTPDRVAEVIGEMALHLRLMECLRDQAIYFRYRLCQMLTPNRRDRALLALPVCLSFLYYLLRPFRLLRTYGLRSRHWLGH